MSRKSCWNAANNCCIPFIKTGIWQNCCKTISFGADQISFDEDIKILYNYIFIFTPSCKDEEVRKHTHRGSHNAFNGFWWINHWVKNSNGPMALGSSFVLFDIYIHTLSISDWRRYLHGLKWVRILIIFKNIFAESIMKIVLLMWHI